VTSKQIETHQAAEARRVELRFGTAQKIREMLDDARKQYGAEEWDSNDLESEVLNLVTEEEA
jgi:hypothetical protein